MTYLTYPLSLPEVPLSAPSQHLWSDFGVPIDECRVNNCYCSWLIVRVMTFVYFIAGTVDDVAFSDAERIAVPRPLHGVRRDATSSGTLNLTTVCHHWRMREMRTVRKREGSLRRTVVP